MNDTKLVEVYQDVIDLKSQTLDNYKYLSPVDGSLKSYDDINHVIMSDFYQKVVDEEGVHTKDSHIYEPVYECSHEAKKQYVKFELPPLPARSVSQKLLAQKFNEQKNKVNASDMQNRIPLGDCSNWTLSSTCGEHFFKNDEIENQTENDNKTLNEDNNNNLFVKLRNKNNKGKIHFKEQELNKSSNNSIFDSKPIDKHVSLSRSCKNKLRFCRYSSVFSQDKLFKKNLEEDNLNLNPIIPAELGEKISCTTYKDNSIKSKISTYHHHNNKGLHFKYYMLKLILRS